MKDYCTHLHRNSNSALPKLSHFQALLLTWQKPLTDLWTTVRVFFSGVQMENFILDTCRNLKIAAAEGLAHPDREDFMRCFIFHITKQMKYPRSLAEIPTHRPYHNCLGTQQVALDPTALLVSLHGAVCAALLWCEGPPGHISPRATSLLLWLLPGVPSVSIAPGSEVKQQTPRAEGTFSLVCEGQRSSWLACW